MTKKGKLSISRTRMRRALFRQVATYEVETIDRFRAHVQDAAATQRQSIHRRAEKLPAEAQELLAEDLNELDVISDLADELAIVALYRAVETYRGKIVVRRFPKVPDQTTSNIRKLGQFLRQQGIDLDRVPYHRAVDELRLLNNAIKHDAGYVSAELARKYPRWKRGKRGAKLAGLGAAYERLKGDVPSYIFRFAERVKL
jgi:hypothetical protein